MKNETFNISYYSGTGCVHSIILNDDENAMDWSGQTHHWGEIFTRKRSGIWNFGSRMHMRHFCEDDMHQEAFYDNGRLDVHVTRNFTENGRFCESYTFTNIGQSELFFRKGEIGIYVPLCDEYTSAAISQTTKCHAHVWCGENATWINALRQGISDKNLGLILTAGSVDCYSIDRDNQKLATATRGNIILHPQMPPLLPGESHTISWELFEHAGNDDFRRIIAEQDGIFDISADFYTILEGEKFRFDIPYCENLKITCFGKNVPFTEKDGRAYISYQPVQFGEHKFIIERNGKHTHVCMYYAGNLEKLIKTRLDFIVDKQQYHRAESHLDGAYLIYDTKDDYIYFNDEHADHNASRERLGMGLAIAKYLQSHKDEKLENSLKNYAEFALREFIDAETGEVFNTVGKNPNAKRLYNAPWAMTFMAELYQLWKDDKYLDILNKIIIHYYTLGGVKFYPNGFNPKFIVDTLNSAGKTEYANSALAYFKEHSDNMLKIGLNYPPHEVIYEQTIVTPAVTIISDMGMLLGDSGYIDKVDAHVKTLERFSGMQPDYRLNGIPIRYWDDYWFGKSALYGDTLHYWSCLTARSDYDYYQLSGSEAHRRAAENCMRNCLCLFAEDGRASCAYVYPFCVDEYDGEFYDEWANDQDFALYFAMQILDKNI